MGRCQRCGGSRIEQYMMPYGPMWCSDCGFRVEDKTATPNPFFVAAGTDDDPAMPGDGAAAGGAGEAAKAAERPRLPLGAALAEFFGATRQADPFEPPEPEQSSSEDPSPAGT